MTAFNRMRLIRMAVSIALFTGLGVSVLTVRLFMDGKRFYDDAKHAQAAEESWRVVVMSYENAAKTYFPGNPYPKRALWELSMLARSAQMRGKNNDAMYIWEVIRRSAVAQRHVTQPFGNYVEDARGQLAMLRRAEGRVVSVNDGLEDPSPVGVIVLWIGLVLWILGMSLAILSQKPGGAFVLWGVSATGIVLWISGALWV